jgi:prolyl 4-hydroxylase
MQKYDQHLDWFDAALYKNDKLTQEMIQYGKKNRLATVFWYLSDVEKGEDNIN